MRRNVINFDRFAARWNEKFNNFDGVLSHQCVDLAKQWLHDNKWPMITGNAKQWISNANKRSYYTIAYKFGRKPKRGDLVIWNYGKYGHIGIVSSANTLWMNVFQQNYPVGSRCRKKKYIYYKCLGWLRKK